MAIGESKGPEKTKGAQSPREAAELDREQLERDIHRDEARRKQQEESSPGQAPRVPPNE